jgi:hypothetical protein
MSKSSGGFLEYNSFKICNLTFFVSIKKIIKKEV